MPPCRDQFAEHVFGAGLWWPSQRALRPFQYVFIIIENEWRREMSRRHPQQDNVS